MHHVIDTIHFSTADASALSRRMQKRGEGILAILYLKGHGARFQRRCEVCGLTVTMATGDKRLAIDAVERIRQE